MKKYLIFIVGIIIGIVGTSYAAYKLNAEQISFDKNNTGLNSDNIQTAIDELATDILSYGNAESSDILKDKTALVNGSKIVGTITDRGTYQFGNMACAPSGCGTGDSQYYALNKIPEGYYHSNGYSWAPEIRIKASDLRNKLNISASKIATGQSIAGITGTYTSDATAQASNIEKGKTAYVNGKNLTGTLLSGDNSLTFSELCISYWGYSEYKEDICSASGTSASAAYIQFKFSDALKYKMLIVYFTLSRNGDSIRLADNYTVNVTGAIASSKNKDPNYAKAFGMNTLTSSHVSMSNTNASLVNQAVVLVPTANDLIIKWKPNVSFGVISMTVLGFS